MGIICAWCPTQMGPVAGILHKLPRSGGGALRTLIPPQLLSSLTARLSDITTLSVITSLRDFLSSIFSDISLDGLLKCNVNHPVSLLNNLQHYIWDAASSYPSLRSSFVCCITLLTELETSPVIPVDGLYLIYHR